MIKDLSTNEIAIIKKTLEYYSSDLKHAIDGLKKVDPFYFLVTEEREATMKNFEKIFKIIDTLLSKMEE